MLLCAVCLCLGQFIWKRYNGIAPLMAGFAVYGIGALAMLAAYRFGSLSVLQPVNSVSYVIAAVLGAVFFQEKVSFLRIAGILLIMAGVTVLASDKSGEDG